jgi:hypothetical protein
MTEPLAVLLLPCRLEDFELEDYARDLLAIPRVIALEPSGRRVPKLLRDMLPVRQARRLRFPGEPRVVALYHPGQYPLARALCGHYKGAELWYFRADPDWLRVTSLYSGDELRELEGLACERATQSVPVSNDADPGVVNEGLRRRLLELEIISSRPFLPVHAPEVAKGLSSPN